MHQGNEPDYFKNRGLALQQKREISDKAKALIDQQPVEALKLYKQLYSEYREHFNEWDAFFALKALKKMKVSDISFASELITHFNDERTGTMYSWLVYDHFIKGKTHQEIKSNSSVIHGLLNLKLQKDRRTDPSYPCAVVLSVFALVDALNEGMGNDHKIAQLLEKLDRHLLSIQPNVFQTKEQQTIENPSDYEKYVSLVSASFLKLNRFEECLFICEEALGVLKHFHFDNDLWFNMRIAKAKTQLGDRERGKALFLELIATKKGVDKWFFYNDLAEIYLTEKNYKKAWEFSVDAAWLGNEPKYMVGLYTLQTRALTMLNQIENAKKHANLIAAVMKQEGRANPPSLQKLFRYFNIDPDTVGSLQECRKDVLKIWEEQRYKGLNKMTGVISKIHPNGKKGFIKTRDGKMVEFRLNQLKGTRGNPNQLLGIKADFFLIENMAGIKKAEKITLLNEPTHKGEQIKQGEIVEGKVKAIVPFGIFVEMKGKPDGLLHSSRIPLALNKKPEDIYKVNDKIEVIIDEVTPKGLSLSLARKE